MSNQTCDKLGECSHERLIILHPPGCIHQHHVDVTISGIVDGLHGDSRSILSVTFLIELDHLFAFILISRMERVESLGVGPQLLHGPCSEGVAGRDEN